MRSYLLALFTLPAFACGGSQPYYYDDGTAESDSSFGAIHDSIALAEASHGPGRSTRGDRARASQQSTAPPPAPPMNPAPTADATIAGLPAQTTVLASTEDAPPLDDRGPSMPLLIYTGAMTLAIYDVEATQASAVALAESMGGYSSQRTANSVTLRVPAERFRETLDALGEIGDVLSLSWDAQDVTDEFNDIEVRLANARAMRERLEQLLDQAESVSDALAIERELQRITLEIERLEGSRREMVDRIAFSTIVVNFSRMATQAVPGDEYRLPFDWLNQLGVERLLSL